ncbi:hypothetical protein D3C72_1564520 [compost metagenome]
MPDDSLVDQVIFAVTARAIDCTGVEHFVARLEQRHLGADFANDPHGIPSQHLRVVTAAAGSDLGVDRVDRDGFDFHQQVPGTGCGLGQFVLVQRSGILDREAGGVVDDCFHWDVTFQVSSGDRLIASSPLKNQVVAGTLSAFR